MTKQDIDQSYTSWLIYSDYLEENNQLALAEQIRFELDYKLCGYFYQFTNGSVGHSDDGHSIGSGNIGNHVGGKSAFAGIGGDASFAMAVGGVFGGGDIGGQL